MSCHDIGHGINTIVFFANQLYEEGKLDKESFCNLVKVSMKAVNYCDGNTYEAVECMIGDPLSCNPPEVSVLRCGVCLKSIQANSPYARLRGYLFSTNPAIKDLDDRALYCRITCMDCYKQYIVPLLKDEEKKLVDIECVPENGKPYISTREYLAYRGIKTWSEE